MCQVCQQLNTRKLKRKLPKLYHSSLNDLAAIDFAYLKIYSVYFESKYEY